MFNPYTQSEETGVAERVRWQTPHSDGLMEVPQGV